jgi:acetyltransferase-like isoleucine patch superfamily enzyme
MGAHMRLAVGRLVRAIWHFAEWLASEKRKIVLRLRYGSTVDFGKNVWISPHVRIETFDGGAIQLGNGVSVGPGVWLCARSGKIVIGDNSLVNFHSVVASTVSISIGSDALIAEHVTIRDQDHEFGSSDIPYWRQGRREQAIVIADNVWLGAKVTITKGVTIPAGSIIGANSVVTRSICEPGVYVGAPAKRVGAEV